jgi:hypothetical protein
MDDDHAHWICLKCEVPYVERQDADDPGPFFHYFDVDDPNGGPLKVQVQHELKRA